MRFSILWICITIKSILLTTCLSAGSVEIDIDKYTPLKGMKSTDTDWGKEYHIGVALARESEPLLAITTLKRALVLMPKTSSLRSNVYYNIGLCYYLIHQYDNAINYFGKIEALPSWDYYLDKEIALNDCYVHSGRYEEAYDSLKNIKRVNPALGKKLTLYTDLAQGDIKKLKSLPDTAISTWAKEIQSKYKDPETAGLLNAILPGSGYLYVGQTSTAITALIVNSLFIATTYHLFDKGYIAPAIITGALEMGWYMGGIYGATESARFYNYSIYQEAASQKMHKENLSPALMIQYAF